MSVVHIASPDDWARARASSTYSTRSLASEGFIHFSRWDQLADTVARHYAGVPDLLVLVVEPADLPFRVENGFPHLYGELPLSAVTEVLPLDEAIARAAG
jgi:glutathione S-transferase